MRRGGRRYRLRRLHGARCHEEERIIGGRAVPQRCERAFSFFMSWTGCGRYFVRIVAQTVMQKLQVKLCLSNSGMRFEQ